MIGQFARMIRPGPPRVLAEEDPAADAPPERFVQKVQDEHGDVFLSPLLEALRAALRARRADASTDAPETTATAPGTEGA